MNYGFLTICDILILPVIFLKKMFFPTNQHPHRSGKIPILLVCSCDNPAIKLNIILSTWIWIPLFICIFTLNYSSLTTLILGKEGEKMLNNA